MSDNKKLYVLKSNKIIEAQYKLSAREQKFILYMASKIRSDDKEFEFYEVKVSEIAEVLNASGKKQGNIHQDIYEMCQNFNKKPIRIEGPNGRMQLINWVASADFQPARGIITFEFSKRLKPLLLNLKAHFTKYSLEYVMQLSSVYSIRFYELLKRHHFKTPPKFTITVEELKTILDIQDSYKEYRYFKKRVLNVAQDELDEKGDIGFTYDEHRVKRKVVSLTFKIHENNPSGTEEIKPVETQATLFDEKPEGQHPVVGSMVMIGFKTIEAQELFNQGFDVIKDEIAKQEAIAKYAIAEDYFQAKIDMLNKENSIKPKKSPKGFLIKALEMDYRNEKEEKESKLKTIVKERKQLRNKLKQLEIAAQGLEKHIEQEEELEIKQLIKSQPTLIQEAADESKAQKFFAYDATLSLGQNYERPTIQAMINVAIKKKYPEAFQSIAAKYQARFMAVEEEKQKIEKQLNSLKK